MTQNRNTDRRPVKTVRSAYEKIAFGGVNDAVRLLFTEEPDLAAIEKMDFYNVAEIRRLKGGGVEIKFYDRMKALECLRELGEKGARSSPLYRALEKCAQSFEKEKSDGA